MSSSNLLTPTVNASWALQDVQSGSKQTAGGKADKIRKYAGEFEANLLANLYKDMQHSMGVSGDEDPGSDTLSDMGVHALTQGIVAGGGIGIAKLLIQHLIPKVEGSGGTKVE